MIFFLNQGQHVIYCIYFQRSGHDGCGPATFTAGREASTKSRAKVDEEGLEIAMCRHGILLQGLSHYRGEIYAYPMYLQKELAQAANVTFFCMDIACRYDVVAVFFTDVVGCIKSLFLFNSGGATLQLDIKSSVLGILNVICRAVNVNACN